MCDGAAPQSVLTKSPKQIGSPVNEMDVEGAIAYALRRLAAELRPELTYHCLSHTRDEVIPAADRLARLAGISESDRDLLLIAAAYHDLGFIDRAEEHKLGSVRIAAQVLPNFGLDPRSIDQVLGMILATRLPQSPRHAVERLLTDADLDGLSCDAFFARSEDLRVERQVLGHYVPEEQWWREQLIFLKQHRYWTSYAEQLRGEGKARNVRLLEERLGMGRR